MSSLKREVSLEKIPSHLFGLTTRSQWKRDSIGNDGKEVKCPGRAIDHRATEENAQDAASPCGQWRV